MRAIFVPLCVLVLLASCRTNNIAQYPLNNRTVLYRTTVAGDAAETHMHISSPSGNTFSEIFTTLGAGIAGVEAERKLRRAINADSLAANLTLGVENVLRTYFNTRTASSPADTPSYVVEIQLEKYELRSGEHGVYAAVSGSTRILQTGTGKLIWENCESVNIPLRHTHTGRLAGRSVGTAISIFNASELLSMSDEELAQVMQEAAEEAGRDLGEELREDAASD